MDFQEFKTTINGQDLVVKKSCLAGQTNSSLLIQMGETELLSVAVMGKDDKLDCDFMPLTVEYTEKYYAAGKIYGSRFIRREGRPTDNAILTGRLIDRTLRPLFNDKLRREINLILTCLAIDEANDPDFLGIIGASLALGTSDIPWSGPVGAIRIGYDGKDFIINPDYAMRESLVLDLLVAGTEEYVNMIEANANEVSEDIVLEALKIAEKEIKKICVFEKEIIKAIGKQKTDVTLQEIPDNFVNEVSKLAYDKLGEILFSDKTKEEKSILTSELIGEIAMQLKYDFEDDLKYLNLIIDEITNDIVHKKALKEGLRPDGRQFNEIRPLDVMTDLLPRVHGSGLFMRGLTQVLSILTLASPSESLMQQGMEIVGTKRYMHHYNFPSFSVGETSRSRGLNRREIGHGALAEKALLPVIPSVDDFPYAIRVVSEVLSSNGSSSMASVCGSSLCLMAGGVPIKEPVAGIAMGLMSDENKNVILTDIQGAEDHFGDMDFKVAGTKNGITALQMDVKISGANADLLYQILLQAKEARLQILDKMLSVIAEPRKELSKYAPKISCLVVDIDKVGEIIGSGGKTIKAIIEETGVEINIEDDKVYFISDDASAVEAAKEKVLNIVKEYEVNEVVKGKVIELKSFGAIVEFGNKTGLLHISEISNKRIENINDVLKVGDALNVKIKKIEDGKYSLSAKEA